ncbi:MAG: hypothetical protein K2N12_05880 [Helicobacter sp.]|nr:hypothetical protein [Helicobacter sp.]
MRQFIISVAAAAVVGGTAFAADSLENTDLLSIASAGAVTEQSEGARLLSADEESNIVGGYYKINYAYAANMRNLYYHRQALKEGRPTIYIPYYRR